MDACVLVVGKHLVHLILEMQFHFLESLLLKFIRPRNVGFGLDLFNLVFQLRMLLGKRPKLLTGGEQVRPNVFLVRVLLH
ncbi:MAG TPA: hypothetical protein VH369_07920 [Bryobacteraceae bacterium]